MALVTYTIQAAKLGGESRHLMQAAPMCSRTGVVLEMRVASVRLHVSMVVSPETPHILPGRRR